MTFAEKLKPWTANKLMEVIGVPRRTAYAWKSGEKIAPGWVQALVLFRLKYVKPDNAEPRRAEG